MNIKYFPRDMVEKAYKEMREHKFDEQDSDEDFNRFQHIVERSDKNKGKYISCKVSLSSLREKYITINIDTEYHISYFK